MVGAAGGAVKSEEEIIHERDVQSGYIPRSFPPELTRDRRSDAIERLADAVEKLTSAWVEAAKRFEARS